MPGRFLIIQTAFIGDVILASALLEQLHDHYPSATLDLLVRQGNESLFTGHPFLNQVLIWQKKKQKYRSLWKLSEQIRAARYDVVINLQRFGATGLLTALSGAGTTIGFDKNPFSAWFTHRVPHQIGGNPDDNNGINRHEVDRNAALLRPLGNFGTRQPRPKLYPGPADYAAVKPFQGAPYVCIAPTSVWYTKQFPAKGWVKVIAQLNHAGPVYLLGAPADSDACEAIRQQSDGERVINLAGKLSLLQSAALMQGALMNYVNDSAPLHLCSAMNAPTTAIFCSTTPAFGFGPLADNSRVVEARELLTCKPCNLHGRPACPLGHFRCAYGIEIEEVINGQ
ncbi:glycosyltransferase family 9 protein [Fibrella sp. HMF5335]|uniref:Glycosyltransferase family 9 protein n=1 Tax=Fibrella rubiginis TaxID=2817060 RepID=A0A939K7L8_9BACT|nr:glycosyltransferase family 9 protein [Fibrella rubiginis]MBO0939581.1 glycosyltransferase family 9 protein [Fibrella rubiginis]